MRKKRQAGTENPKNTQTFYSSWTLQTVPVQMKRGLQNYRGHSQATWVKCATMHNSWYVRQSTPITACMQHTECMYIQIKVIQREEQLLLYVLEQFSSTAADHLQQAASANLALTSRIRANFLFSKESKSSCFCFFHFLFSAFSWSSRCASALFFDLCISRRRSYGNIQETISKINLRQNLQGNANIESWFYHSRTEHYLC